MEKAFKTFELHIAVCTNMQYVHSIAIGSENRQKKKIIDNIAEYWSREKYCRTPTIEKIEAFDFKEP